VDVGVDKAWVIPQDGKRYYLSGSLTIEKKEGDHPYMDWSGTLLLKQTEIPRATSRAGVDEELTRQISDILKESHQLTPGKTTRAELLKTFTTEGGLSTAKHRTFVHRICPYIKVDVDFTLSTPIIEDERPTDVVSKISRPYLEWSIAD
jgi:predicted GNAT family acetyltransferase